MLNHMPFKLGVREQEWGDEGYPEIESFLSEETRNLWFSFQILSDIPEQYADVKLLKSLATL